MRLPALLLATLALAAHGRDMRYCGPPDRDPVTNRILRDPDVKREFRRDVPCPSTGRITGACPGWSLDHVWPLDSCGCDKAFNLQWLKNEIKSGPGPLPKDRWERQVYQCRKADRE